MIAATMTLFHTVKAEILGRRNVEARSHTDRAVFTYLSAGTRAAATVKIIASKPSIHAFIR